jgi:hypothetical protein
MSFVKTARLQTKACQIPDFAGFHMKTGVYRKLS